MVSVNPPTTECGGGRITSGGGDARNEARAGSRPLIDPFGRRVTDLRVSITDRCNFRCTYCMPQEGMPWLERDELLTYEEQARIVRVGVERFGFESVRITGGEPTVRAHLPRLIAMLAPLGIDIAMTSNGVKLPEMAHDLADAGLRRINVSLDSLRPEVFRELTRRDDLDRVIAGIDAALDAGLDPVKVNCVVMRGINDDEVADLAAFGREKGVGVRFIEFMPLDADGQWSLRQGRPRPRDPRAHRRGVPARAPAGRRCPPQRARRARRAVPLRRRHRRRRGDRQRDRAVLRAVRPHPHDRRGEAAHLPVRARGVRPAGHPPERRPPGAADDELDDRIADEIVRAVGTKWAGHRIGQVDFVRPDRSMSQIGG